MDGLDPADPQVWNDLRDGFLEWDTNAALAVLHNPHHAEAVLAANARPGTRDETGQLVVDPRTANVLIVCACDYRRGPCGRHLGGVWRTRLGTVLVYTVVWSDFRLHIDAAKSRGEHQGRPEPGFRLPEDLLADTVPILLRDARDIWVSCPRHDRRWSLDLRGLRQCLERERVMGKHQKFGSRPGKVHSADDSTMQRQYNQFN